MAQKPTAKASILDAYERAVIENGERAATLEAVAADAGVSKGGLLYHFASKNDLVAGLVERMDELAEADLSALRVAPEGIVRRFIRSSVDVDTTFDHTYIALTRLAQSGLHPEATDALTRVESGWRDLIATEVSDPAVARLVLLVSDGLYYNSALWPGVERGTGTDEVEGVINALDDLIRARSH